MIRNRVTPEGHKLGSLLAKLCDDAEPWVSNDHAR
jgi:hypothetical protein